VSELARRWRTRGLGWWETLARTAPGRLIERSLHALAEIEVLDRSMALAAQAFTSIVPIMVVAATLRPNGHGLGSAIGDSLALPSSARAVLQHSVPAGAAPTSSVGILGLVVAIVSATSFSRALEKIYLRIWQVPKPSYRTAWRWLATIVAIVLAAGLVGLARRVTSGDLWLGWVPFVVQLAIWTAVWSLVPFALVQGAVRLRPLVVAGAATAVSLALLSLGGAVYLPIVLRNGARQYGVLGLVFTYISWLFAICVVVVAVAVIARVCAADEGVVGRFVRGPGADGVLRDRWTPVEPEEPPGLDRPSP
jgi:membrane protein